MDNDWITDVYYTVMGVYNIPERMGVRFRDEGMFVRNVLARKEALYVEHPAEEEIYKQIDGRRLVVVRGPKGDGTSMATFAALVRKMLYDRAVVVNPIKARDCLGDAVRLQEVVDAVREVGREPIFYLDISLPGHYPQRPWREDAWYAPNKLDELINTLDNIKAVFGNKEVATVVVLSNDLYAILRHELKEHATVEVNSGDAYFLKELAQAYSGCGEDVAKEVAEAAAKYDCGRAVLAVLAADWLMQRNCNQEAVAEALKAAEDKARTFFIDYIWRVVLNGDRPYANVHAPLILLRTFKGPMSAESAEDFLISLGFEEDKVRYSTAVRWLATRHCSLIESAIRKAVETALTKRIDEQPYSALRGAKEYYYKHFKAMGYFK
jgi:hypothetical protein